MAEMTTASNVFMPATAFRPRFDNGVLRWEKSAGRHILAKVNEAAFERWLLQHFPNSRLNDGMNSSRIPRSSSMISTLSALRAMTLK